MNTNSGHGHVQARPDGQQARCGGPAICAICKSEQAMVLRDEWNAGSVRKIPPWAIDHIEVIGRQCADGGTCHHQCEKKCFRKEHCVPLSACTWLDEKWRLRLPSDAGVVPWRVHAALWLAMRAHSDPKADALREVAAVLRKEQASIDRGIERELS